MGTPHFIRLSSIHFHCTLSNAFPASFEHLKDFSKGVSEQGGTGCLEYSEAAPRTSEELGGGTRCQVVPPGSSNGQRKLILSEELGHSLERNETTEFL